MNLERILLAIKNLAAAFAKPAMNEIYTVATKHLGQHLTLNNAISEEVGCAEAVSFILLNAGFAVPRGGIAGVNALIDWMLQNGFEEVGTPLAGAIITAHQPDHNNPNFAHTGVCFNFGIGSNGSNTGIFAENYSYQGWQNHFGSQGSITRYFYHK